ncbi:2Fe-2S iron-sulfur cluster-binding protein [Dactylosporangium sp. CA-092794]|uniref:2Fe-2S iron-sulfur cluster-binding protein n=1 Tax=Dactylosporangium sp. CA-092794 TaxID=3239929 RepID=UPI003D8E4B6A
MPTVTVLPDDVAVTAADGEGILAALYRSGFGYRTGCRRGGCGVCKVDLVDGEVDYPVTVAATVLTPQERTTGTCLTCRAVPRGDVVIRLRDERLRCLIPFLHPERKS